MELDSLFGAKVLVSAICTSKFYLKKECALIYIKNTFLEPEAQGTMIPYFAGTCMLIPHYKDFLY